MKKSTKSLIKTAGIAAGVSAAAGYILFHEMMHRNAALAEKLGKILCPVPESAQNVARDERDIWFQQQSFDEFEMINDRNYRLKAYLLKADKPSDVYVFCSHGYRNCGKGEFNLMAKFYHDKGYNVFLVDHQASGESDGTYIGFGYYEYRDCLKWLDYMLELFGKDIQIILHGVSMGSATVMIMNGEKLPENVKFTVADCGYTSAYDEFAHNAKSMHVPLFPVMNIANAFNKKISGYDFREANPLEAVTKATLPILFIHGGNDDFVPTYMAGKLYEACSSADKKMLIVEGAAHAESYPTDSVAYESMINEFIDKYIN